MADVLQDMLLLEPGEIKSFFKKYFSVSAKLRLYWVSMEDLLQIKDYCHFIICC